MRKFILDIPVDYLPIDAAIDTIAQFVKSNKPHHIVTVNPEFIVTSRTNSEFKRSLISADLSVADGIGIILAQTVNDLKAKNNQFDRLKCFIATVFRWLFWGQTFVYQRITGIALCEAIMYRARTEKWKVYLLGSKSGVAQRAREIWSARYHGLNIVGASSTGPTDTETIPNIKAVQPDILLVAYGAPKQELFISRYKTELKVPVMIGIGGTLDSLVGTKLSPPDWAKRMGLEWLVYLLRYPGRFGRMWRATIGFIWLISRNPTS